jgi:hypothetical protein
VRTKKLVGKISGKDLHVAQKTEVGPKTGAFSAPEPGGTSHGTLCTLRGNHGAERIGEQPRPKTLSPKKNQDRGAQPRHRRQISGRKPSQDLDMEPRSNTDKTKFKIYIFYRN